MKNPSKEEKKEKSATEQKAIQKESVHDFVIREASKKLRIEGKKSEVKSIAEASLERLKNLK